MAFGSRRARRERGTGDVFIGTEEIWQTHSESRIRTTAVVGLVASSREEELPVIKSNWESLGQLKGPADIAKSNRVALEEKVVTQEKAEDIF